MYGKVYGKRSRTKLWSYDLHCSQSCRRVKWTSSKAVLLKAQGSTFNFSDQLAVRYQTFEVRMSEYLIVRTHYELANIVLAVEFFSDEGRRVHWSYQTDFADYSVAGPPSVDNQEKYSSGDRVDHHSYIACVPSPSPYPCSEAGWRWRYWLFIKPINQCKVCL